jgi:hypothetical protein
LVLFKDWCDFNRRGTQSKRLWSLEEKQDGRTAIRNRLLNAVRSHYDDTQRIADDVQRLGYAGAAAVLRERLPRTKRARSGELGEILATELVEEELDYKVPVRRLRYKDGREMALRGDDFLGIRDDGQQLRLLKGEAKSRQHLSKSTVEQARNALDRDDGRPTQQPPYYLLLIGFWKLSGLRLTLVVSCATKWRVERSQQQESSTCFLRYPEMFPRTHLGPISDMPTIGTFAPQ